MSRRLPVGGRLIERDAQLPFTWNGRAFAGYRGDTVASALLANGQVMVGRSFKYHRPRGIVASGPEEPNGLMNLGAGAALEPNARSTLMPLRAGMQVRSQNHWPSLRFDLGALNRHLSPLLPAGFYYKTFMYPRAAWKRVFEPMIRQSAGLGKPPQGPDPDSYQFQYDFVDVLIAGGGIAGLAAARAAAASGARVLVLEQARHWGGRALVDGGEIDGRPVADWVAEVIAALRIQKNVRLLTGATVSGVYDHGYVLAAQQDLGGGARERLWRIRAGRIVAATGAIERPIAFAGNDVPGVMLASAIRDYVDLYAVLPGERTVVITNNDDAYRTALALLDAGGAVPAVLDVRANPQGPLADAARGRGVRVLGGWGVARVQGTRRVRGVQACPMASSGGVGESIACDAVAMSGGWSPVVHLWSHCGGRLRWDEEHAHFAPDPQAPPLGPDGAGFVLPAGAASGALGTDAVLRDAHAAGMRAAAETGFTPGAAPAPQSPDETAQPVEAVWMMPGTAEKALMAQAFLDFQNDVKVSDVRLAAREGYVSVEHAKRYTTLGMATDQGKISNINGLAVLAQALDAPIPDVGTTTFRPPYTPVTLGALAGDARGALFKPVRKTALDGWHAANGAHWEPVGDWRRPYCYPREGESAEDAVQREVLNTRGKVGVFDASTLGKILVRGPDAGRFLDLIYTNIMSGLKPGRCRYGLMCNENGFLFDDGVVARLDEETFLCHTTTGGADRVHAWLEEWLQTEWWDLQVYTINLTEQYAQIAVVGPQSRGVLEALGGMDVGREALAFMDWAEGRLAGIPARVFRISFSGELSYEIAVPRGRGMALWQRLLEVGAAFGIAPYGTEALHIMRAEKGYIMIGEETDGTVTPQDLGLHWAVSKKKADFIGKRAQMRVDLTRPGRKQLVGLRPVDPHEVLPEGAHAIEGEVRTDGPTPAIGHVTSTYFSPTLGYSIAMALIERGSERLNETLTFPLDGGKMMHAKVVDPVFLDKDGSRMNG